MSIPTDLYTDIMSYNFDYQVVAKKVGGYPEFYFPKRIHTDFLFALQNGTDGLSTTIIRDARKKLKSSLYIVEYAKYLNWFDIPHQFVVSVENGRMVFHSGNLSPHVVTRQVLLHLKPSTKMTKNGLELMFDTPEQILIHQNLNTCTVSIDNTKVARKQYNQFLLMCDWLFYFLTTGIDSGVCQIHSTPREGRLLKYASQGSVNSSTVDRRNKKKALRQMLRLWKKNHPTLFGRMDIDQIVGKMYRYSNINLHNAMYSI